MALTDAEIRRLALALPQAVEADHHGSPSFRVGRKIFCTVGLIPGKMMVKLEPEDQHNLCAGHSEAIVPVPGSWGLKGATHVDLAQVDEALAAMLLRLAWTHVAPA